MSCIKQATRTCAQSTGVLRANSASQAAGLFVKYGVGTRVSLESEFTLLIPSDEAMGRLTMVTWTALNDHAGTSSKVLLVTDGVFQALGGLLVINSFMNPQTRTVTRTRTAEVKISPAVSPEFLGLAATGRF